METKQKLVNWILGIIGGALVITGVAAWNNSKDVPQIKEIVKSIQDKSETERVELNTRLYNAEKWIQRKQIEDSIFNSKNRDR